MTSPRRRRKLSTVSDGSGAVSEIADYFFSDGPGVDGLVVALAEAYHARVSARVAAEAR